MREERMIGGRLETVISVELMRRSDAYTIAHFVPAQELMGRAAQGVFDAVKWQGRIAIVVGGGNNGGDGFALAAILADAGHAPHIYRTSEKLTEASGFYLGQAKEKGVSIQMFETGTDLDGYDMVVDCILGTGFAGKVRGIAREAIQAINRSGAYVVSVDLNSGLNGDTGEGELAVVSDLTVSIGYYKQGMFRGQSHRYINELMNVPIGILLSEKE